MRFCLPLLEIARAQEPPQLDRILAAVGIVGPLPPSGALDIALFEALLSTTVAILGRSDIGFEIGTRVNQASYDLLSLAVRACPSIDAALHLFARYWRLVTPAFRVQYRRDTDGGHYSLHPAAGMSPQTFHAMCETFAVSVHGDLAAHLPAATRLEVDFSMPRPRHAARYRQLAPTLVRFSALALPEVRVRIPTAALDLPYFPPSKTDERPLVDALRQAEACIARADRVGDWVELLLREAEGVQPSLAQIAELLAVSPRTLSRQLAAEGRDLRALGAAIRFERACALLRASLTPIEVIAARLGYGSTAAFGLAFRRHAGCSPGAWRRTAPGRSGV
ncbi:MAG: AraC family transcriptional regulator ligand-binding domain-containing protein [Burkholderiaceae bacterium]|nr:AraC family transcriptional regulator ligand-binding domain-containing protein [Burkholderiaceae bacterium]